MSSTQKIAEFDHAMQQYYQYAFYNRSGVAVSTLVVTLQAVTLFNFIFSFSVGSMIAALLSLLAAYLVSDFISGLVHLYMDNNVNYTSLTGPFVAAFHLHHKAPQYRNRHPLKIYFYESGTKYWLVVYLALLACFQLKFQMSSTINLFFTAIGIFSSLAEVSHYWCHNARKEQVVIRALQKYRVLLPYKHHGRHHAADNVNYAFLNGVTDPVVNWIAKLLYDGYKRNADVHALSYKGIQTSNR